MTVVVYLSTGNCIAVTVFNLNSRPRLPATAKGWRGVIGDVIGGENAALIALIIGN